MLLAFNDSSSKSRNVQQKHGSIAETSKDKKIAQISQDLKRSNVTIWALASSILKWEHLRIRMWPGSFLRQKVKWTKISDLVNGTELWFWLMIFRANLTGQRSQASIKKKHHCFASKETDDN